MENSSRDISLEDMEAIAEALASLINNTEDGGKSEVMQAVNDSELYDNDVFGGSVENTTPAEEDLYNMLKGDGASLDLQTEMSNAEVCAREAKDEANVVRYQNAKEDDIKVATSEDVESAFKSQEKGSDVTPENAFGAKSDSEEYASDPEICKALEQLLDSGLFANQNPNLEKEKSKSAKEEKKPSHSVEYKKDCLSIGDEKVEFKRVRKEVDWGSEFVKGDLIGNLTTLRGLITKDIIVQFGGLERINTIYVYGEQLVINGICYSPVLNKQFLSRFPLDTVDYIRNGTIASLFNWNNLRKMSGLITLWIDSGDFYTTIITPDLGWRKDATALFKICPSLRNLTIGGDTIGVDGSHIESTARYKRGEANRRYFRGILDGYKLDVYKGTEGFQGFAFSNLKNYATNRGNKSLFRYLCGTAVRSGVALFAGSVNLGAHLLGGTAKAIKTIKSVFKDAMTPVDRSEI